MAAHHHPTKGAHWLFHLANWQGPDTLRGEDTQWGKGVGIPTSLGPVSEHPVLLCITQHKLAQSYDRVYYVTGSSKGVLCVKGACCQVWQSEFELGGPHSGKREANPASCPLTST